MGNPRKSRQNFLYLPLTFSSAASNQAKQEALISLPSRQGIRLERSRPSPPSSWKEKQPKRASSTLLVLEPKARTRPSAEGELSGLEDAGHVLPHLVASFVSAACGEGVAKGRCCPAGPGSSVTFFNPLRRVAQVCLVCNVHVRRSDVAAAGMKPARVSELAGIGQE